MIKFDQFTAAAKWRAINRFYPVSQTDRALSECWNTGYKR